MYQIVWATFRRKKIDLDTLIDHGFHSFPIVLVAARQET
jgi:hypothetical protein